MKTVGKKLTKKKFTHNSALRQSFGHPAAVAAAAQKLRQTFTIFSAHICLHCVHFIRKRPHHRRGAITALAHLSLPENLVTLTHATHMHTNVPQAVMWRAGCCNTQRRARALSGAYRGAFSVLLYCLICTRIIVGDCRLPLAALIVSVCCRNLRHRRRRHALEAATAQ